MFKHVFVLLLLVASLASCSYEPVELVQVKTVEVVKADADSISLIVNVELSNPNSYNITLTDPDLDLFINSNKIGKAVFYRDLVVEKDMVKVYEIPVAAAFNGQYMNILLSSLGGILGGKMLVKGEGSVKGKAGLFSKRFPFSFEEDLSGSLQGGS